MEGVSGVELEELDGGWAQSVEESARLATRTARAMGRKVGREVRFRENTVWVRRSQ